MINVTVAKIVMWMFFSPVNIFPFSVLSWIQVREIGRFLFQPWGHRRNLLNIYEPQVLEDSFG